MPRFDTMCNCIFHTGRQYRVYTLYPSFASQTSESGLFLRSTIEVSASNSLEFCFSFLRKTVELNYFVFFLFSTFFVRDRNVVKLATDSQFSALLCRSEKCVKCAWMLFFTSFFLPDFEWLLFQSVRVTASTVLNIHLALKCIWAAKQKTLHFPIHLFTLMNKLTEYQIYQVFRTCMSITIINHRHFPCHIQHHLCTSAR